MDKLILKNNGVLKNLNELKNDLGELELDIKQFKVPRAMVVLKEGIKIRLEKVKNLNGELVETGKYSVNFPIYDLNFIKLVIENGSTEIGNPINIIVERQNDKPNLESFEEGEFIPISFKGLKVKPKKVNKKIFVGRGKSMVDAWVFDDIKVEADAYIIGKTNEK